MAPAPEGRDASTAWATGRSSSSGTTGDPATPYEYAVDMARQLDSAVLVTHEGEGHTAYGSSACVRQLVQAYLNDGRVPAPGARCAD